MQFSNLITQMRTQADSIAQLVKDITPEQAHWKPDEESWSILEVINHLYDEEQFDFRVRLDIMLHKPDEKMPPIDPAGWVVDRAYNDRNLVDSVNKFMQEREKSLEWLQGLIAPDWEATYAMPWGDMRAGDMFAAWVAHDLLHMRQLVELKYQWTVTQIEPYQVRYAGEW